MDMVGTVVGGRFEILRQIGEGGMGTVWEARHETLPRRFAIKILRKDLAGHPVFVERFRREAIAAAKVDHPNIIDITDFGRTAEGELYLVMEHLQGNGLDQVLSQQVRLPLHRALPLLVQLADALDTAHRSDVVHRDLKPENILLIEVRGRKDVVKVLDFGVAQLLSPGFAEEPVMEKGQIFGTAEYMSPEQATDQPCDGRSDIYAMGCLAYELVTGDTPFTGQPQQVLRSQVYDQPVPPSMHLKDHPVPPAFDALILRCLAKEPAKRYQTGEQLRQDLLKVRGLLISMGAELATATAEHPAINLTPSTMHQGWRSLGGTVPEIFAGGVDEPVIGQRSATSESPAIGPLLRSPEQVREDHHETLREVAIALVQHLLAPRDTSEELQRLLVIEEEIASLTGALALAEQGFGRIRFEFGHREQQLRHAILDLSVEKAEVEGQMQSAPHMAPSLEPKLDDLNYQIRELSHRTKGLDAERAVQINDLAQDVQAHRAARLEREQEAAEIYRKLSMQVEALRPAASQHDKLRKRYAKLDDVRRIQAVARR